MTQAVNRVVTGALVALVVCVVAVPTAEAIPAFKKEFDALYAKKDGTEAEQALAAAVEKAKCNVCHVAGKEKKVRNAYGDALAELLDKKADEKDKEKIIASLKKVEEMKSIKDDESSPTFGELIHEGKLPAGE